MTTTRAYRRTRIANDLELLASASRRRINAALRDEARAAAASESAALLALFRTAPAQAWARLAVMPRTSASRQLGAASVEVLVYHGYMARRHKRTPISGLLASEYA